MTVVFQYLVAWSIVISIRNLESDQTDGNGRGLEG